VAMFNERYAISSLNIGTFPMNLYIRVRAWTIDDFPKAFYTKDWETIKTGNTSDNTFVNFFYIIIPYQSYN